MAEAAAPEPLHGQLMLALYRCGRQAEALEAYRAARRTLVDESASSPAPSSRPCRTRSSLRTRRSMRRPVRGAACRSWGRLARRWRAGTGELAELFALLADTCEGRGGLVLSGSAGIGKTRLAADWPGTLCGGGWSSSTRLRPTR